MKGLVDNIPAAVSNIYGITEGGGGGTFNLYPEDVLRKPGSMVNHVRSEGKIVDFEGKDVPRARWRVGFHTRRMMKEYYKNPEMTAETLKNALALHWRPAADR